MTKTNDGGPAFPVHGGHHPDDDPRNQILGGGMSLRDWFAGQIAGGMAAFSGTAGVSYGPNDIAGRAYQVADAMLVARGGSDD